MPAPAADRPRTLPLHLWWTTVLVLAALGGAGLAVAADRPGNPVQRPELTYRADLAAQPWVDHLRGDLELMATQGAQLSTDGRDVLGALASLDLDGANAALRMGEATSAGIATLSAALHDTITRAYLRGIRLFLEEADPTRPIHELVNELLMSPMGRRDWPLRFWSKDRLMSVEARRGWVKPDLAPMP